MDRLLDWITSLPKALQLLLVFFIIGLLGFSVWFFVFAPEEEPVQDLQRQVLLEMPSATLDEDNSSQMDTYRRDRLRSSVSASDYWDNLGQDEVGGLIVDGDGGDASGAAPKDEYLDPEVYSPTEIYQIQNGTVTKAEVDARHARLAQEAKAAAAAAPKPVNQDSLYFARMEKAYQMAMKYGGAPAAAAPEETAEKKEEEVAPRTINVEKERTYIPEQAMQSDGLISSLEQEKRGMTYSDGDVQLTPVRATFLKTERVVAGQRVIMRLIEDLRLSDGTMIPANTHVTGICEVGSRLDISVRTISYGGRIYRTDMSVYDNDGTEGIYCPVIERKKGKKAASRVAGQAASSAATLAATLFTGNPLVGRMASTGINELSGSVLSDGSVAINVVAGYEFYIFENIKRNGKKNDRD